MIIINLEPPKKPLIQVPEPPKPTIRVIIVNVEKEPEK